MKRILSYLIIAFIQISSVVQAQEIVTGKIHTIHVNIDAPLVLVQMEGKPTFGSASCPNFFTGNLVSDEYFMKGIFPLLLTAKTTNAEVVIYLEGCQGSFPRISSMDLTPRL